MKKILLGSFLTASIIILGSVNVKAQSNKDVKVIKREAIQKETPIQKNIKTKNLNPKKEIVSTKKTKHKPNNKVMLKEKSTAKVKVQKNQLKELEK